MSLDLFSFILVYFIIINSTIGYGFLAAHSIKINYKFFDISFIGLLGGFVLLLISYTTHLFTEHGYIHNLIILIIGILSFVYFFFKEENKNNIIKLNIFFFVIIYFIYYF